MTLPAMNFRPLTATALLLVTGLLTACGGGGGSAGDSGSTPPVTTVAPQVTLILSNGAGATGTLVLTLEADKAPSTTANFLAYVKAGFYNGTVIHRNAPGFVLQGGGYAGPLVAGGTIPTHKPTNAAIALEVGRGLSNLKWTLAMARGGAPDTATSEFFINLGDNTFLDTSGGGYAVFGTVTTGSDFVTTMANAPCAAWAAFLPAGDCLPSPNFTITSATQTR
jgi:cyclophilin family peptidyl-prolyl cis-trans isomerase